MGDVLITLTYVPFIPIDGVINLLVYGINRVVTDKKMGVGDYEDSEALKAREVATRKVNLEPFKTIIKDETIIFRAIKIISKNLVD